MRYKVTQPIQPLTRNNPTGELCFRGNAIVRYLFERSSFSLYQLLHLAEVPAEDREQFAQLIGLSVSEAQDCLSNETQAAVRQMDRTGISEQEARINYLRERLDALTTAFKGPVSLLYDIPIDVLNTP
jgi:hypothetical protein